MKSAGRDASPRRPCLGSGGRLGEASAPAPELEKVSFDWVFPKARQVFIVGTFNDWQPTATPLRKCGGDRWLLDLALKPGRYEYRFVVDGQMTDDPGRSPEAAKSAGHNSVLVVCA
ncbi:MAG TPA: glycogen-binding domain-containing protein [Candidatus Acidoferrum sp.]|nr:glycogen-binding domain-containing protein [Candidatus Acidoferrum sp.]